MQPLFCVEQKLEMKKQLNFLSPSSQKKILLGLETHHQVRQRSAFAFMREVLLSPHISKARANFLTSEISTHGRQKSCRNNFFVFGRNMVSQ